MELYGPVSRASVRAEDGNRRNTEGRRQVHRTGIIREKNGELRKDTHELAEGRLSLQHQNSFLGKPGLNFFRQNALGDTAENDDLAVPLLGELRRHFRVTRSPPHFCAAIGGSGMHTDERSAFETFPFENCAARRDASPR